ncbi:MULTISPECIES: Arc family DNA-binding protein [Massilia]|uniref:Arc family DNA-binding protein n=1 Tax=Massilia rubra TaxID=2607910 RepID=A0ABX0LKG0_9BURK|nr:Arc family DNA-binding protein [Massilia rubra]NHZ97464.1 Arc family DNA-binding protein [Massilia sp. CCM 8734]
MASQPAGYPLRMPSELREWFSAEATKNGRSLNSELVHCLTEIRARSTPPAAATQQLGT